MDLERLYELQAKLDKHILNNNNIEMSKEELLDSTILALLVEIGELANTTRCFKHWSKKGMMEKEVVLDEFADCLHFYLSIGNQIELSFKYEVTRKWYENYIESLKKMYDISHTNIISKLFNLVISRVASLGTIYSNEEENPNYSMDELYQESGLIFKAIQMYYNFGNREVENAYLIKHKENYKRQAEGY